MSFLNPIKQAKKSIKTVKNVAGKMPGPKAPGVGGGGSRKPLAVAPAMQRGTPGGAVPVRNQPIRVSNPAAAVAPPTRARGGYGTTGTGTARTRIR